MRWITWCVIGLAASAVCAQPAVERAAKRPNIVFIYADDHAQRAVSAYGSDIVATPNIDRLAASGMRFTQSFVANSICGPARATVLTGLHSHLNGKMTNQDGFRDELPTFATLLQGAGYRTAMIGKWHLPTKPRGFDHWMIERGGYYNLDLETAEGREHREGYTTEILTDEALVWMAKQKEAGEPFCLWLNHSAVHRTWMPGPGYLTRHDEREIPEPETLFDDYTGRSRGAQEAQMRIARDLFPAYDLKLPVTGEGILDPSATGLLNRLTPQQRALWDRAYGPKNKAFLDAELEGESLVRWKYQRYIKDYLRCVSALDDSVGRVLDSLTKLGLDEDTIVIYSSDQGFFLGEHGWYDKRWMYEPSLRTPFVVRWPGVTEPGSTCDALIQNIDVAPTLLELGNAKVPAAMQGRSLRPWLEGEAPNDWRDAVYYHYHQKDSGRTNHTVARHIGVRTERFKLMYLYDLGDWELYDLQEDPHEIHNLAGREEHQELLAELKEKLRELVARYEDETAPDF
ncbi:MAG: sulfatase [Planctomycetota bacterium]